jgi:hypothetical protein
MLGCRPNAAFSCEGPINDGRALRHEVTRRAHRPDDRAFVSCNAMLRGVP